MAESPEQRELSLVGKVELRIALVETDLKLETTLKTYLPPLLLKLASEHLSVRNKVISVCQHINTRIKPPSIKLPVSALLKQYKENTNLLIRHFDLLYIQQGIDRLSLPDRLDLLPALLRDFHANYADSVKNAASLFHLLLKLLHSLVLPIRGDKADLELRSKLGLDEGTEDASSVAAWLGKLLLLTPGLPESKRAPGLGTEDLDFLHLYGKSDLWTPNAGGLNLIETKVRAARFLASGAFVDSEKFIPALLASSDANSRLSDIGDDILKQATPAVSLEDPNLLERLYQIYLGTRGPEGSLPARPPLQIKILGLLRKSKRASSFIAESTQIIKEGLVPLTDQGLPGRNEPVKQGLEASKLRGQIFAFTNWLARISSSAQIESFAPALVDQLRAYIESQGWPNCSREGSSATGELDSRNYGYESIGLLAAACPRMLLLDSNLDLLRWLFDSLSSDSSGRDTSISIEQALSSVIGTFGVAMTPEIERPLTDLLLYQMALQVGEVQGSGYKVVRSTQFTAVRFANRCLPFCNSKARWIDVLAIGSKVGARNEVMEEGSKGLDPYWHRNMNPRTDATNRHGQEDESSFHRLPNFDDLVAQFYGPHGEGNASEADVLRMPSTRANSAAALFCRAVLIQQALDAAGDGPTVDIDWERKLGALVETNVDTRQQLKNHLGSMSVSKNTTNAPLQVFLQALFINVAEHVEDSEGRNAECLLELCALGPDVALSSLAPKAALLQKAIFSTNLPLRVAASNIFGILASHPQSSLNVVENTLRVFEQKISAWDSAIGAQVFQIHGAVLATASFISRLSPRDRLTADFREYTKTLLKAILDMICDSRDALLVEGAISALSELAAYAVISLDSLPAPHAVTLLVSKLKGKATGGSEKAILALGDLAMLCTENEEDSDITEIMQILYGLHEARQPELQFAVGSAISSAAVGWASEVSIGRLDVEGSLPYMPRREKTLSRTIDKILKDCKTTKPSLRQASVIWLLCLVQYCGQLAEIKDRLRECQLAFKGFLADHDSLNRESAARGLTFVYEKGDRDIKDELIKDLVSSFTGNTTSLAGNVSDQTQLFEPGALPTGDNQSITTYKDIMSLAAEVGDPSLVYRFMSMASNNAIWSSRAAFGHFGLSKILSDSSIDGYLAENSKLYPVLFRYRFDANTNVRASMNDIWKALVKDPTAVIDKYFDSIMDDLLRNVLGKEWRVRQACCAAIADLVQGRPLEKYEKYLDQIWTLTFKVCDDIKGSVREAAQALARVLAGILTRSLEAGDSSAQDIDSMLKVVLPFLFSPSGLEASSKEIQVFSLSTLLDIIKSSNSKTLRPFVPDIVGQLVALLSSFENEGINYLHLNADKYGVTTQQIDDARLSGIKGSPLMDAVERCLDAVDEATMAKLQASLEGVIKTAVGLPSKVGASRVIVSLSTRHNFIFKPYADQFLRLIQKQLLDRNDTVASAYASTCGYLARLATDSEILKLISYCRKLYFDSDDDRHRLISGDVVYATSKQATDRFNALAAEILPFVFVAQHDPYERAQTLFKNTWNENVGGSRAVLLYLKDIIHIASQYLDSPRWSVKHTSAFAIAECVNSSGNEISDADARILWPVLEKAIAGKTWEGKERILKAFVRFAKNSKLMVTDMKVADQMQKIVMRESKRNNSVYRQEALACLGEFIDLREDYDLYPQALEITEPIIQDWSDDSAEMDVDSPSGGPSSKTVRENTLAHALSSLMGSINPKRRKGKDLSSALAQVHHLINSATAKGGSSFVQDAIYDAEERLFDKMADVSMTDNDLEATLVDYAKSLSTSHDQVERSRAKASKVFLSLVPLARNSDRMRTVLVQELCNAIDGERSVGIHLSLKRARDSLGD